MQTHVLQQINLLRFLHHHIFQFNYLSELQQFKGDMYDSTRKKEAAPESYARRSRKSTCGARSRLPWTLRRPRPRRWKLATSFEQLPGLRLRGSSGKRRGPGGRMPQQSRRVGRGGRRQGRRARRWAARSAAAAEARWWSGRGKDIYGRGGSC
jgi:hypothetical protein